MLLVIVLACFRVSCFYLCFFLMVFSLEHKLSFPYQICGSACNGRFLVFIYIIVHRLTFVFFPESELSNKRILCLLVSIQLPVEYWQ